MTSRTQSGRMLGAGALNRALGDPERSPLGTVLETELEEAAVPELWHRIDARLALPQSSQPRAAIAGALLAVAAIVMLWLGLRWAERSNDGPLALAGGHAPALLNAAQGGTDIAFADGSHIDLAPFTELRVVKNDAHTFATALAHGRSTFDVRPGGPRRWLIDAGAASVEVLGTRFAVRREGADVRVDVERGVVLVRSTRLASGSVRLTAGQSVVVTAPAAADSAAIAPAAPALAASSSATSSPAAPSAAALPAPSNTPSSPANTLAASPAADATVPTALAHATATRPTETSSPDAVDRALLAADGARRRGDRLEAVSALEAALAAAGPGDKRRGLAALSLARLVVANDPRRAASVLRESFGAMPGSLVEDALARRVEAEARAGNFDEARRLATEYRRRFPAGQRANEVAHWSGD